MKSLVRMRRPHSKSSFKLPILLWLRFEYLKTSFLHWEKVSFTYWTLAVFSIFEDRFDFSPSLLNWFDIFRTSHLTYSSLYFCCFCHRIALALISNRIRSLDVIKIITQIKCRDGNVVISKKNCTWAIFLDHHWHFIKCRRINK